ncbi:MAG TPA: dienelactone hydrolase family protein [Bacteroidales bacterium]|nr:dienelactone hydrolase family protein [Bacteroidales bacterium]
MKAAYVKNLLLLNAVLLSLSSRAEAPKTVPKIREETVELVSGGVSYKCFVAYDENIRGRRPAVLVLPEWWGLTDYLKMRARKLAELGYLAMAVDVFGQGRTAKDPKEAGELTKPYHQDPTLAKTRIDDAIRRVKQFPQCDPHHIAAIGYCFGGNLVLNAAKLGAGLEAVVSFHGSFPRAPLDKKLFHAKVLICQGDSDKFVPVQAVDAFKRQLDSIGVENTVRIYPNATHAFTNPDATRLGKQFNMPIAYNPEADEESWNEMIAFFDRIFKK